MSETHTLTMPKWGLSMSEGRVNSWLKDVGDEIAVGDEIVEVESEKIAGAIEAAVSGVLRRQVAQEDDVLSVGALLGIVADPDVPDSAIDAAVEAFLANYVPPSDDDIEAEGGPEKVDIAGQRIRYLKHGSDGEPVILIHGFGGDLNNWLFNHTALAAKREVYALDLPGHGESSKDVGNGTLDSLADTVLAFMDSVGVDAAHLVGHSMGGAVSLKIAQRAPERVRSLVLIGSAGMGSEINTDYTSGFVESLDRRSLKPLLGELFADSSLVTRQLVDDMLKYKRLEGVTDALKRLAGNLFVDGTQQASFEQVPSSLGKPILVIWGEEDRIIPAGHATNAGGDAQVEVLAGHGHMVQMEAANEVNRLIESFLG